VLLVGPRRHPRQPLLLSRDHSLMGRPPARAELPHRDYGQDEGDEPPVFDQESDQQQGADQLPDETGLRGYARAPLPETEQVVGYS
jgi:hypothetical protein